jgi:hypothetical protein
MSIVTILFEIYTPVAWLCFYLSLCMAIGNVCAFRHTNIVKIVSTAAACGALLGLCWPVALPLLAFAVPFLTIPRHDTAHPYDTASAGSANMDENTHFYRAGAWHRYNTGDASKKYQQ